MAERMEVGQPARLGRPPMQDEREEVSSSSQQTRQQRMRLAQRTYRARRQEALDSATSRNKELSRSLDNALAVYSHLHEQILGSLQLGDSPDEIQRHLNDAEAKMAAIASGANESIVPLPTAGSLRRLAPRRRRSGTFPPFVEQDAPTSSYEQRAVAPEVEEPGMKPRLFPHITPSAREDHFVETSGRHPVVSEPAVVRAVISLRTSIPGPAPVPTRIARACLQRTVSMLSGYTYDQSWAPTLTIPLQLLGQEGLMANTLHLMSFFQASVVDFRYPTDAASQAPRMYRAVEGGIETVPRRPAPFVQQIAPGRTRSILETHFTPLQGEWLEAVDVEEYLEERGITLRNAISPSLPVPLPQSTQVFESGTQNPTPVLSESGVEGQELSIDHVTSRIDATGQLPVVTLSADFRGHEPGDYSVFERLQTHQTYATIPMRSATDPWVDSSNAQSSVLSGVEHQTPHADLDVSDITIDLDKLVQLLADKAVCLGPVPGIRKDAVDESIRGSIVATHKL